MLMYLRRTRSNKTIPPVRPQRLEYLPCKGPDITSIYKENQVEITGVYNDVHRHAAVYENGDERVADTLRLGSYSAESGFTKCPLAATFFSYRTHMFGMVNGDLRKHKRSKVLTSPDSRATKACQESDNRAQWWTYWQTDMSV